MSSASAGPRKKEGRACGNAAAVQQVLKSIRACRRGGSWNYSGHCSQGSLHVVVLLLSCWLATSAHAVSPQRSTRQLRQATQDQGSNAYIVQLKLDPVAAWPDSDRPELSTADSHDRWGGPDSTAKLRAADPAAIRYASFVDSQSMSLAGRAGIPAERVGHLYHHVMSGFALLNPSPSELAALAADPAVAQVTQGATYRASTDVSPTFLGLEGRGPDGAGAGWDLVGTNPAQKGASDAGERIVIGVLDTGIVPEVPSFSDRVGLKAIGPRAYAKLSTRVFNGTCALQEGAPPGPCSNSKIVACKYYFVAGVAAIKKSHPEEVISCRDVSGHGTHVASIAAGNWGVQATGLPKTWPFPQTTRISGVAPRARIAVYKVLWGDEGTGQEADLIAAIDDAVKDGVDVINFSLGRTPDPGGSMRRPLDMALLQAARAGVFIAAAAGNNGPSPGTVENALPWVTSVAMTRHSRNLRASVKLLGRLFLGDDFFLGSLYDSGSASTVLAEDAAVSRSMASLARLCRADALSSDRVRGKVLVCDREFYSPKEPLTDRLKFLKDSGAAGLILLHTEATANNNTVEGFPAELPAVSLNLSLRAIVRDMVRQPPVDAVFVSVPEFVVKTAPRLHYRSGTGPATAASGRVLAPDVAAPGVGVLGAWLPATGQPGRAFDAKSGTSMSAPHVAGMAALLLQKNPTWTPGMIKSAIMTTAYQTTKVVAIGQQIGTPFEIGAGHIDPVKALNNPGVVFNADFKDFQNFLCGVERMPGDSCVSCATPVTCAPENLNLPSITLLDIAPGSPRTIIRKATSVLKDASTWAASIELEGPASQFLSVSVSPPSFSIRPRSTQRLVVKVVPNEAALLAAQPALAADGEASLAGSTDGYMFGAVRLAEARGGMVARLPLVVRVLCYITAPAEVTQDIAGRNAFMLKFSIVPGFSGPLSVVTSGLHAGDIAQGTMNITEPGFAQPVNITVNIPEGATLVRLSLFDSDYNYATDMDMSVLCPGAAPGEQGTVYESRTQGNSNEQITLVNPRAGACLVTVTPMYISENIFGPRPIYVHIAVLRGGEPDAALQAQPSTLTVKLGVAVDISLSVSLLEVGSSPQRRYFGVVGYKKGNVPLAGDTLIVLW